MDSSAFNKWNWKEQLGNERIHGPLDKCRSVIDEFNSVKGMSEMGLCYEETET